MSNIEEEITQITDEMTTEEVIAAVEHNHEVVVKTIQNYIETFEKNFGYNIQPRQDGTIAGYIVFFKTMTFFNFQSYRGLKISFTKAYNIAIRNGIRINERVVANQIMERIGECPLYV
jgi:hypothetical protein